MDTAVSVEQLEHALQSEQPPLVIDVRRQKAFCESGDRIVGALYRDPDHLAQWADALPRASGIVVYCVHGHQVSQGAASALVERGVPARFVEGGITHWKEDGGQVTPKPVGAHTRWVTRERPKIDRVACPWLISRFIDREAEFIYVPAADVLRVAAEREATAYDIPGVAFTRHGDACSLDAFIDIHRLGADPALTRLATIVRAADTGNLAIAPQAPGLLALSLGLSRLYPDDHEMLSQAMVMYDALYLWCREGQGETHTWNLGAYR